MCLLLVFYLHFCLLLIVVTSVWESERGAFAELELQIQFTAPDEGSTVSSQKGTSMNKTQLVANWQQLTFDHEVNILSSVTLDCGIC